MNIASDVSFAIVSDTGNCAGSFISSGSFQCPKFFLASSIFFVLISMFSHFSFSNVMTKSLTFLIDVKDEAKTAFLKF